MRTPMTLMMWQTHKTLLARQVRWKGRNYSIDGGEYWQKLRYWRSGASNFQLFTSNFIPMSDRSSAWNATEQSSLSQETGRMFMLEQFKETV